MKILQDIEDPEEQHEILTNHHIGKCNHRGMTETLLKLSKEYYYSKSSLTTEISAN